MKVKICGLTNLEDAQAALAAGADLLGFIFADSPRQVTAQQAAEIINNLPPSAAKVGVFANQEVSQVQRVSRKAGLDFIQLHGDESPVYCRQFDLPVIKAFRVQDRSYLEKIKQYEVDKYLLDTYVPDKLGGTGKTFNWELAREANQYGEVFIAGGLKPTNIEEAIATAQPAGVDIGSGVEAEPGKKDHDKLKKLKMKMENGEWGMENKK